MPGKRGLHPLSPGADGRAMERAGDMGEAVPAESYEMVGRQLGALGVVRDEAQGVRVICAGEGIDDGQPGTADIDWRTKIDAAAHDDNAINLLGQEGSNDLALAFRVIANVAEEDENLRRSEGIFDSGTTLRGLYRWARCQSSE